MNNQIEFEPSLSNFLDESFSNARGKEKRKAKKAARVEKRQTKKTARVEKRTTKKSARVEKRTTKKTARVEKRQSKKTARVEKRASKGGLFNRRPRTVGDNNVPVNETSYSPTPKDIVRNESVNYDSPVAVPYAVPVAVPVMDGGGMLQQPMQNSMPSMEQGGGSGGSGGGGGAEQGGGGGDASAKKGGGAEGEGEDKKDGEGEDKKEGEDADKSKEGDESSDGKILGMSKPVFFIALAAVAVGGYFAWKKFGGKKIVKP